MHLESAVRETEQSQSGVQPVSALMFAPLDLDGQPSSAMLAGLQAENIQLRAELEQLRAERTRLLERQQQVMELLKVSSSDRLIHDLRNMLNERELLRTLVEEQFD